VVTSIRALHELARSATPRTIAVAWPHSEDILIALDRAAGSGLVRPLLAGQRAVIEQLRERLGLDRRPADVIECASAVEAVEVAVRRVAKGEAQMLMKGDVATAVFLKGILNRDWGLRKRPLLSHVAVFEVGRPGRLVLVTDVAMNIAPDVTEKAQILENAVGLAHKLGIERPRVAALAAVDTVSGDMPATVEAAALAKMADRGLITGCIVDGPLALDNALLAEAARQKGITGPVAGCADILLVPDIEAGNVLYKALGLVARLPVAAVVVGASAPVVLTSRADSDEAKFNSIALAAAIA